jgi:chemotaxis protein methyltransferase CheR
MISVLVVDDSVVVRRLIVDALGGADGIEVIGTATTIGIDDNYERVAAGRTSAYRVRTGVPAGAVRRG